MGIIAALPFSVEDGGEIFNSIDPGFHKMNKSLLELGTMTIEKHPDIHMSGVGAIASGIAHILKIHGDMRLKEIKDRYAEENWRKVMIVFALSQYRAYNVRIDILQKKDCNDLLWAIYGEAIAQAVGTKNKIYTLQLEGEDIALFDQLGLLIPIAKFPHKLKEMLGTDSILGLEDYEKDILLTYLKRVKESFTEYKYYIVSFIEALENSGARVLEEERRYSPFGEKELFRNIFEDNQKNANFWNIPSLPIKLPAVFHDKLVFASAELKEGKIIGLGKNHVYGFQVVRDEGTDYFSGLLPLSEKLLALMEGENPNVKLLSIKIDESEFVGKQSLKVEVRLNICKEEVCFKKIYWKENILYASSIPLVTIFPYVKIPKDYWKNYYLVLRRASAVDDDDEFLKNFTWIQGSNIDLLYPSTKRTTEKLEKKGPGHTWYLSRQPMLPSYVKLCEADFELPEDDLRNRAKEDQYLGCLCVGEPVAGQEHNNKTFRWGIDLGTRNTIVAFKDIDVGEVFHTLVKEDLYCALSGSGIIDDVFARQCFVPAALIEDKFATMCRVYSQGYGEAEFGCYEQGCALFPNLDLIYELMKDKGSLLSDYVVTDIKFGARDKLHEKALYIYLYNMLWLGSLECVLNGASSMQLCISYPRGDIKKRIEQIWNMVCAQMRDVTNMTIESIEFYTEAEANARYLQMTMANQPQKQVGKGSTFGICDVGDGTCDFNLFLGEAVNGGLPPRIQYSMRYAGGEILVDTVIRLFAGKKKEFRKLWNIPIEFRNSEKSKTYTMASRLIDTYEAIEQDEKQKGEIRALWENKRNIVLMLIENVGFQKNLKLSTDKCYSNFTTVLLFKYWHLFRVYGEILKLFGRKSNALSFKLFLYGGGKQALQEALNCDLEDFENQDFGRDVKEYLYQCASMKDNAVAISVDTEYKKLEVVEGMVNYSDNGQSIQNIVYDSADKIDDYYTSYCNGTLPDEKMDEQKKFDLMKLYERYVSDVRNKEYFEIFHNGQIVNIFDMVTIGTSDGNNNSQEIKNRAAFGTIAENCWRELWSDKDNPRCLLEVLFCVKMSNYLLMENL